jgi:hypothetical protein
VYYPPDIRPAATAGAHPEFAMRGCLFVVVVDRLTIRPTPATLLGPLLVVAVLSACLVVAAAALALLPSAERQQLLGDSLVWGYGPLVIALLVGAVVWYMASRRPLVLDRVAGELMDGWCRRALLKAVAVEATPGEGTNGYQVEIVLPGGRLLLGRSGWSQETDRRKAEASAARIAEFLGLPAVAGSAGGGR